MKKNKSKPASHASKRRKTGAYSQRNADRLQTLHGHTSRPWPWFLLASFCLFFFPLPIFFLLAGMTQEPGLSGLFMFMSGRFFMDGMSYPAFNFAWNIYFFILATIFIFAVKLQIRLSCEEMLLLIFFLFACVSSGLSAIRGTGLHFNAQILSYWCIFLLIIRNFRPMHSRILSTVILTGGFFIGLYGIHQFYWGLEQTRQYIAANPELLEMLPVTYLERLSSNSVFATFVYPNVYASFLLFLLPLSFFMSMGEKSRALRIFFMGIFMLSFYNLLLTDSRGGMIVFVVVAATMLLFLLVHDRKKFLATLSVVSIITAAGLYAAHTAGILPDMASLIDRIRYWDASIHIFRENPFTGTGPETFRYHHTRFKHPASMEARHPHSVLFSALTETGFIGTLLLFGFLLTSLVRMLKKADYSHLHAGLGFAFLALFLHNLVDFSFANPAVAVLFFTAAGMAIAGTNTGGRSPEINHSSVVDYSPRLNTGRGNTEYPNKVQYRLACNLFLKLFSEKTLTRTLNCLIIITVFFTAFGYIRYEFSVRNMNMADRATLSARAKLYYLERAEELYPENFEIYRKRGDMFSREFTATGNREYFMRAENDYRRAVILNPFFSSVYRNMAMLYQHAGKEEATEKMFKRLLAVYPTKKQYNIETALFYKRTGNDEKFYYYYERSRYLTATTSEEAEIIEAYEKWIKSQKLN